MVPERDMQLVQIVGVALAETAARSGDWLVCKPGCTPCCIGVFAINQLDAARLQQGLKALSESEPSRASAIRARARASVARLTPGFPGDLLTGVVNTADDASFDEFANDEPCAVLDPDTGRCDLYESRPMTCRVFGPPVRSERGLGVCELCYHGATAEQIAACEMPVCADLEAEVLREYERNSGKHGKTLVAFALTHSP